MKAPRCRTRSWPAAPLTRFGSDQEDPCPPSSQIVLQEDSITDECYGRAVAPTVARGGFSLPRSFSSVKPGVRRAASHYWYRLARTYLGGFSNRSAQRTGRLQPAWFRLSALRMHLAGAFFTPERSLPIRVTGLEPANSRSQSEWPTIGLHPEAAGEPRRPPVLPDLVRSAIPAPSHPSPNASISVSEALVKSSFYLVTPAMLIPQGGRAWPLDTDTHRTSRRSPKS
jgi:hypothetical protein